MHQLQFVAKNSMKLFPQKKILWNQFFSFTKFLSRQCRAHWTGNYRRNLLSPFFGKNFMKAKLLLKNLLCKYINRWFHKIFFQWERISCFFTLCSSGLTVYGNYANLLPPFWRKNSVKSFFTKELYSKLIWRKKLCVAWQ